MVGDQVRLNFIQIFGLGVGGFVILFLWCCFLSEDVLFSILFSLNKQQNWLHICCLLQVFCGHHVPLEEFTANDSPLCQLNKILDHWSCLALNQPKKYASFVQLWLQLMQVYMRILVYATCVVQIQQKSMRCSYARNSKSHSSVPFSTKNQRTKKASEKKSRRVSPMFF